MVVQLSRLLAAERAIEALARPHGVVERRQLVGAGIGEKLIDRRVKAGWLRPMHRGVYAVGLTQSDDAPEMAAVLACGDEATVSHRSAGALWGLLPKRSHDPVEVTVVTRHAPRRKGIRVHRTAAVRPDEVTKLRRIRVTTPARTLLDLSYRPASSSRRLRRPRGDTW
jgi:predicted transcriptional regulator of viral defense system